MSGKWSVVGVFETTGAIIIEAVEADSSLSAFAVAAHRHAGVNWVAAVPTYIEPELPGESVVDSATIIEQGEVFPLPVQLRATDDAVADKSLAACYVLWDQLADVPVSEDGEIEHGFLHFSSGTPREDIWRWLERQNPLFLVGEVQQGIRLS